MAKHGPPGAKTPPGVLIEVCVTGLAGARTAAEAGADRLELCAVLPVGGTTPSVGLVTSVLEAVDLPVIALIRPREGGFRYHAADREVGAADIAALAALRSSRGRQVAGFAIGALTADGALDRDLLREWRAIAPEREWCLHRAFDHAREPLEALESAIDLGFDRILTSGLAPSVPEGLETLARLVAAAAGRIEILPGGGVTAEGAARILARTGVRSLHLSASRWAPGGMNFEREGISLGSGVASDEARHLETDGERLRSLRRAIGAAPTDRAPSPAGSEGEPDPGAGSEDGEQ